MDVIAAISTASALSAIGILRVSGEGCFAVCERVFRAANGRRFSELPPREMVLGVLLDRAGDPIDQVLAVRFPGKRSYTGEDCGEFHCHGSPVVLAEGLQALFAAGARQAGRGEFTKRAFLSGNLDLTQAEAVIDLIEAETAGAARNAAEQLGGALRRRIEGVYQRLLNLTSQFYAVVDYPDEDIEDLRREDMARELADAEGDLGELLDRLKISTGVISNIGWSGQALEHRLKDLFPSHRFAFVLASSEYGIRKPDPLLFQIALKKARLPGGKIWFCGDNPQADIQGAQAAGMFPVWYQAGQKDGALGFPHLAIASWRELMEALAALTKEEK